MPRYRRPYLDQYTNWAREPILRATAVPTGVHTHRSIAVAELHLVVVTLNDSYEPQQISACPTVEEGIAAAERLMAAPDSRGIMREWRLGDVPSGETAFGYGGQFGRRGEPDEPGRER